jgi:hypothetical protein
MSQEVLYEVMPPQEVKEKTTQQYYYNAFQRDQLEMMGFIPVDPTSDKGVALKTVREILI